MESPDLNTEFILIGGSFGMLFLTCAIITFIYLYQRKLIKRKLAYQQIEDLLKRQELKSTYSLLAGQDLERQRIAEELHDNLGSILITLNMYVDTLATQSENTKLTNLIEKISNLTQRANDETRKLAHRLDLGALSHFGLQSALTDLISTVNDNQCINIKHNIELNGDLNNEVSLNLYRVTQELINNTLKHAKATEINIDIGEVGNEYISLIYEDNGIGFSWSDKRHKGIGLHNISSRVEKMNGQLSVDHERKKGFTLTIEIPYK